VTNKSLVGTMSRILGNGNRTETKSGNGNDQWKMPDENFHFNVYRLDFTA